MAFIAINAKADITGSKKGKLTPAQNAMMNAFCLPKKTGIFDFGGKCTTTSDSYDIIGNNATVKFNNGFFVVCGRLVQVEQETSVDVIATGETEGYIIASFNLSASGEDEFKVFARGKSQGLTNDDLNEKTTGTYDFVLCEYKIVNSKVVITPRNESPDNRFADIYISRTALSEADKNPTEGRESQTVAHKSNWSNSSNYATWASYASTDQSKGTIEWRLTSLGFNQGSITPNIGPNNDGYSATLTKIGKYAILSIPSDVFYFDSRPSVNTVKSYTFTLSFKAKNPFYCYVAMQAKDYLGNSGYFSDPYVGVAQVYFNNDTVTITNMSPPKPQGTGYNPLYGTYHILSCHIGFEISEYKDGNGNWVKLE